MSGSLTIGVLGAAKISGKALLRPALDTDRTSVTVIAARDRSRAQAQADEFQITTVVDSYDDVLASDVDAIYNPLPISLHHEWTVKALRAGKHVLCEKPLASNAVQAAAMVAAGDASGLVLMEAFHWRHHPLATRIRELLDRGVIGAVESIDAVFTVPIDPADDVRQSWELSGGALMDLGCYPVQWARFVAGSEPEVVGARMTEGRPLVDVETHVDLEFPGGVTGHLHTAMHESAPRAVRLEVSGADGSFRVDNPLAPHRGHLITVTTNNDGEWTESVEGKTTYHHQLEAFRDAVLDGAPVETGGEDSIATMRVIDAAYRAAGLPPRGHEVE